MAWRPDYATSVELADYRRTNGDAPGDPVQLALAVTSASRAVDRACGRQFGRADEAVARSYTPVWDRRRRRWVVVVDDVPDPDDLTVTVAGVAVTDWTAEPVNAVADGKPAEQLVFGTSVTVIGSDHEVVGTTRWGWLAVPDPVKQATLMQGNRFASRRDSPYGIAGSPDAGSEMRLLARLDPDVAVSLGPYRRWWASA